MPRANEDDSGAIREHYDLVIDRYDEWPDDAPEIDSIEDADVLAAWSYVQGYANGLGMTTRELLDAVGIGWEEPAHVDGAGGDL